jgi:hypothetical protein
MKRFEKILLLFLVSFEKIRDKELGFEGTQGNYFNIEIMTLLKHNIYNIYLQYLTCIFIMVNHLKWGYSIL